MAARVETQSVVVTDGEPTMSVFASAADAVAAAVAMQQASTHPLRVGVSVGDVTTAADGDIGGRPVVEASRLCATAQPAEILVAETVRQLVRGRGGFVYEPVGELALDGVSGRVAACRLVWQPASLPEVAVPFPAALTGGFTTAYVGRAELLDRVIGQWRLAQSGTATAVLLAGEPGVGKTRTAAEVARRAHADGALVLYGRCDDGLRAPYQPFIEALSSYTAGAAVGPLGRLPGELARLLPDLPNRVDGLPAPVAADPGSEEHRLFEATTSWLLDAAADGGIVLVLDDMHWATKPTLLLTLHLLRAASVAGARLLVLITYRDTDIDRAHPLSDVLAALRQVPGVERAPVDNLTAHEVVALMEANAGHEMGDAGLALGAAVFAETEGNPFFVAEVLRHLVETGALQRSEDRWVAHADVATITIPEGVRDVVGRRLSRLSVNANEVLTIAAVQGREVDVDVLVALSDAGETGVLDALDEAVRARLVEETGVDRFRFAHALVRTTLYEELSAMRRRLLHRRIADALEKLRPHDVVALAYHCAQGGPEGGDVDRAVRYGLAAAEQSLEARAFADAEDRFSGVLELLDEVDFPDARQRVAALCGLGESQRDQGNPDFRETLLDASRRARELGDTALLVRAVLNNSRGMASIVGALDEERIELIEVALDAIGPESSAERARLLAQLASEVMFSGDNVRRLALTDEAEAMARELDDKAVLGWVLARTGYAAIVPARWERLLARGAEGVLLADAMGDPSLRVFSRVFHSSALLFAGRISEAFEVSDEMVAIGDAECAPLERWIAHVNAQHSAFARGGATEAARRNNASMAMGQAAGAGDVLQWWAAGASGSYWLLGEGADLADAAGVFAQQFPLSPVWLTGWAWLLVEGGRPDEALEVIAANGLRTRTLEDFTMPLVGTQQLAALSFELEDAELAALTVPVLEKYVGCWAHYWLVPVGPVAWALGCALSVLGEYDRAVGLLDASLTVLLDNGFADHAMQCRVGLARILLTRNGDGDAARARDLFGQARAHAERIPAPRMVERIDGFLAISG